MVLGVHQLWKWCEFERLNWHRSCNLQTNYLFRKLHTPASPGKLRLRRLHVAAYKGLSREESGKGYLT